MLNGSTIPMVLTTILFTLACHSLVESGVVFCTEFLFPNAAAATSAQGVRLETKWSKIFSRGFDLQCD
jgi:hypothetical protein